MKKYLLFYLLLHIAQSISAQKVADTITSLVDTINIYGKIIDEDENPVPNTLIISHTLDENYYFKRTKSDKNGEFKLSGINPVDKLLFLSESGKAEFENSQSRYLLVKLEKLRLREIRGSAIQAKRLSERKRIEIKQISRQSGFDEENYEINDAYPGGLNKLYQLLKSKLVYPANAISANIEGVVNVRFTVLQKMVN
ncbi:hypothetical protein [Pedobacter rhodius]|uniref:TonB C-terminal domain-containing protein n=1 Tax=Pedobacter rhodius TaxID=3004098 RepID=A0ABT4KZY8_9SPHI|nr:hypothetical protein [Pedobacter sp. SJ11]MCZ4224496.1 hypothetical protein [Pedobacter sp. SJ11]